MLSKFITIFEAPHKIFYLHSAASSANNFILDLDTKKFPWDKSINAILPASEEDPFHPYPFACHHRLLCSLHWPNCKINFEVCLNIYLKI